MAYTDLSSTFVYKGLLTYQQMDGLGENDKYFQTGNAAPTGNWVPTGDWTFTPDGATTPVTIDQNNDEVAFKIDSEATTDTKFAMQINGMECAYMIQDISSGYGLWVARNIAEAGTFPLVTLRENNATGTQPVLKILHAGVGFGIDIDTSSGSGFAGYFKSAVSGLVATFQNDGNNANRAGVAFQVGTDDNSGTNTHCTFKDGDADIVGTISSSGGTVSYNPFTGSHPSAIKENKEYDYGTVMILIEVKSNKLKKYNKQPEYTLEPCNKKYSKKVFGIYSARIGKKKDNQHMIFALGDGHILVCKDGGNIEDGDYLTTSNKEGYAMKQDDDLLHNYTIAKAILNKELDWKKEKKDSKLIACSYHAQ